MKNRSIHLINLLTGFVAGIGKHYSVPVNLTLNDVATTTHDLSTAFQAVIAADEAVKAAEAQRAAAIVVANTLAEGILPEAKAFKAFVMAAFGSNPSTLADFDLKPRKVSSVSTAVRSAAAKKAAATRKALGTKGAAQKRLAKKELAAQPPAAPSPAVAPAPAPAAPLATPAAAPVAPAPEPPKA